MMQNTKQQYEYFILVSFTISLPTEEKRHGWTKGKLFLCCFARDFVSFLSKHHTSWSSENLYNYNKAALSLGRK